MGWRVWAAPQAPWVHVWGPPPASACASCSGRRHNTALGLPGVPGAFGREGEMEL